jgi:tripartite-type tricarboxylate transporter receptor subunit TctC
MSAASQHIKSGKLRALASFGATRSKLLPDVPTLKELGYNAEYYLWVGLFAPKGTPPDIVATLSAALDKAAESEQFKTVVSNLGQEYAYQNAKDFAAFWDTDAKLADEAVQLIGKQG